MKVDPNNTLYFSVIWNIIRILARVSGHKFLVKTASVNVRYLVLLWTFRIVQLFAMTCVHTNDNTLYFHTCEIIFVFIIIV